MAPASASWWMSGAARLDVLAGGSPGSRAPWSACCSQACPGGGRRSGICRAPACACSRVEDHEVNRVLISMQLGRLGAGTERRQWPPGPRHPAIRRRWIWC